MIEGGREGVRERERGREKGERQKEQREERKERRHYCKEQRKSVHSAYNIRLIMSYGHCVCFQSMQQPSRLAGANQLNHSPQAISGLVS